MDLKLAVFLVSTTKVDNLFNLNTEVYWIFGHVTCPANYNARTIDTDTYPDASTSLQLMYYEDADLFL